MKDRFDYSQIPEPCMAALRRYVEKKEVPGGFLRAVLEGDLNRATTYADGTNLWLLPVYTAYLYNEVPSACHGSPEKVRKWIGKEGISRDLRDQLINFLEAERQIAVDAGTPFEIQKVYDALIKKADAAWRDHS